MNWGAKIFFNLRINHRGFGEGAEGHRDLPGSVFCYSGRSEEYIDVLFWRRLTDRCFVPQHDKW